MSSDLQPVGSVAARFRERLEARRQWETENPDLAAAWNEALAEDHRVELARENARRNENLAHRIGQEMRRMGVPLDAIDSAMAPRTTAATEAARKFVDTPAADARFLLFLGPKGTGKTVGAALALKLLLARHPWREQPSGGEARQRSPGEFALAATFARLSGYNATDREWFERCCTASALVLDDVGAEAQNEFSASMLDECLTRRHGNRLRTILTSNLDSMALRTRLGERLSDRISETCVIARCTGDSLRRRA